jgi:hypothetical protein
MLAVLTSGLGDPVQYGFVLSAVNPSVFCLILHLPHYTVNVVLAISCLIVVTKYLNT